MSSPLFEDTALKVILAHALLKEACEKGDYHRRAKNLSQFSLSTFTAIEIAGYSGDEPALADFFREASDGKGTITPRGVTALRDWLSLAEPAVRLTATNEFGSRLLDDLTMPPVGRPYKHRPNVYRVLAWSNQAPQVGTTADQKAGLRVIENNYAYRLAAADYFPRFEVLQPDWNVKGKKVAHNLVEHAAANLVQDGLYLTVPEMMGSAKKYVLKPYPKEPFDDLARHREELHTKTILVAQAGIARDGKKAASLLSQLRGKAKAARTTAVRKAYQALADRLAAEMKRWD